MRSLLIVSVAIGAWLSYLGTAQAGALTGGARGHLFSAGNCIYSFSGEITKQLADEFRTAFAKDDCEGVSILMSSPGGDVDAAMAIGRMLRSKFASVNLFWLGADDPNICASACVFIYVGAVDRHAEEGARLGLHRPYSIDPSLSFEDSKRRIAEIQAKVLAYLREMNVSTNLFDLMNAVPPDAVSWIMQPEIDKLIGKEDPAYADWVAGAEAKRLGVTPQEVYRRKNLVANFCKYYDPAPPGLDAAAHVAWTSAANACADCVLDSGSTKGCSAPH